MSRSAASCFLSVRRARQGRSRCLAGRSLRGCPPNAGVALFWRASWPGTAAWGGSRRVCSARRSVALLAGPQHSAGKEGGVGRVIIGVDPHKLSATIEVLDQWENVLGRGRFGTDRDGYRQMLTVGRHVAQRLVADGETVLDVPAKAVRPGPGVLDRPWPQDRRHRRARDRGRRRAHAQPDAGQRRRRAGCLCGCWPTAATNLPAPAPARCPGCTGCYSSSSPVAHPDSCPPPKPKHSWPRSDRGMARAHPTAAGRRTAGRNCRARPQTQRQ